MSDGTDPPQAQKPAEQRAEELMQRLTADGSRLFGRIAGRVREEIEDIVAEARSLNERKPEDEPASGSNGAGAPRPRART